MLEIFVVCSVLEQVQRLGRKYSLVTHTVIKIISQLFKAQTLSDRAKKRPGRTGQSFRLCSISEGRHSQRQGKDKDNSLPYNL